MPRSIIPEAQNQNSIQEAAASEKPSGVPAILTASEIKNSSVIGKTWGATTCPSTLTSPLGPKHIWNTRRTLNP